MLIAGNASMLRKGAIVFWRILPTRGEEHPASVSNGPTYMPNGYFLRLVIVVCGPSTVPSHMNHISRNSAISSVDQRLLFAGSEEGKLLALRQIFRKVRP